MTKSTIARERLAKIKSWRETYGAGSNVMLPTEEAEALALIALAAVDSEPVAWTDEEELRDANVAGIGYLFGIDREANKFADPRRQIMLYRHAQPVPEKYNIGDATMRHIFTPTGMTNVSDMQAVFDRVEAVLVGMEQPVPVVPVTDAMAYAFHHALTDSPLGDDDVEDIKAGLRAALVNGFNSQPAPVAQCPYPCGWDTLNKLAIQDAAFVALSLVAGEPATESIRQAAITNSDRLLKVISACRAATLAAAPQEVNHG
ncbi:hypothetical protein [Escherichia coli]|uniref:hypothetical protein n=1 Tax=Escherichia coli TaxID=562 RepID=UPI0018F852AB|nr:hypothetical protein [Escherichia coli]